MKKLQPSKVKGIKAQKNKPPNIPNASSQTPKKNLYVAVLLLKFQNDL
jgi:hypothetical protein